MLTGVLYVNTDKPTFLEMLNLVGRTAGDPAGIQVRPGREVLEEVMEELR